MAEPELKKENDKPDNDKNPNQEKLDYEKLGFKCGLEIHQQVETRKLFCNCKSLVHDENPVKRILERRLRPVAGEKGEIDAAALYEATKGKKMIYEFSDTSSCLVEIDEEPPHSVNKEALEIALQVAKMMKARVVDELLFMRKIVIDGSNVSGFQRTALVAENGRIETSKGIVMVPTICLEEEAAQKISTTEDAIVYSLDRLGVPLIEIATDASLKDPEHAKETAEKLGMILRSTGKVKRGIGTIRQDLNVSIEGASRVEVKGFQDLRTIPKVIEFEARRQMKGLAEGLLMKSEVRKAEPDGTTTFMRPMPGADRMYPETDVQSFRITHEYLKTIHVPKLIEEHIEEISTRFKLDKDITSALVKEEKDDLLIWFSEKCLSLSPGYIADLLLSAEKQIQKQYSKTVSVTDQDFEKVFVALEEKKIPKEAVLEILSHAPVTDLVIERHHMMTDSDLREEVKKIISENKDTPPNALVGRVMAKLRGKADGKKIVEIVKELS